MTRRVLRVEDASKVYMSAGTEVAALSHASITLTPGTLTGIVGPSGSGKTTLLMIAGVLEPPSSGRVLFGDDVISHPKIQPNALRDFRRAHIGFVFQKANLIPFLTAFENVLVALDINDQRGKAARARARHLLEQLGVGHRLNNHPKQLSGGEQQRVSIARALANSPGVLLADEPTAALDGQRAAQIMKLFRDLADKEGVAVSVVTHDHRWIDLFDTVVELEDGVARVTEKRRQNEAV